jgi:hypothetical protein
MHQLTTVLPIGIHARHSNVLHLAGKGLIESVLHGTQVADGFCSAVPGTSGQMYSPVRVHQRIADMG